jgi:hypothetical protein
MTTAPSTTGTVRSLVAPPKAFDGSALEYPTWKRQVKLYAKANVQQLPDNESKQLVALSYMQTGKASLWSGMILDHMLAGTFGHDVITTAATATAPAVTTFTAFTWDEFWGLADTVFNPPNLRNDAAMKLEKLEQGSLAAEEYFITFDMYATLAGYEAVDFDSLKIRIACQRLNGALVRNLHSVASLPTTWIEFKNRAVALDNNFRIGLAYREKKPGSSLNHASRLQNSNNPFRQGQQSRLPKPTYDPNAMDTSAMEVNSSTTTASTNRVEGTRDELMKAGACFYCRTAGHMKRDCPLLAAKNQIRPSTGYQPLQRPNGFRGRSQSTELVSVCSSVMPAESVSRIASPTPTYSPPRFQISGFGEGQQ